MMSELCAVLVGPLLGAAPGQAQGAENPGEWPSALYVPEGARGVQHKVRRSLIHDLSYEIAEAYPATRITAQLQETLKSRGWFVPELDPLNEDLGPSHVSLNWARWSADTDWPDPTEGVFVRHWECQWQNAQGALVRYVLRYRRASLQDEWSRLRVVAVYWPPEVLSAVKKELKK